MKKKKKGDETSNHIEEKKKKITFIFQKWNPEHFLMM